MNPLNDDELNALLQQAKARSPEPPPDMAARALHAYEGRTVRPAISVLLRPVSVPLSFGALAAVLLILVGALSGRALRQPSAVVQTRTVDCSVGPQGSSAPHLATLTFNELRPVRQIRPRVVRSIQDDQ